MHTVNILIIYIYPISAISPMCLHQRRNPVLSELPIVVIIPAPGGQSTNLSQTLKAPPAVPHVSGRVMHTSAWMPRSIHWFRDMFVLTAELILKVKERGQRNIFYCDRKS